MQRSSLLGRVLGALLVVSACRTPASGDARVRVHENGAGREITASAADLLGRCEAMVAAADGMLRLAVSSATIDELRASQLVVEVEYPEPKEFTLPALQGRRITVQRLLIPLSGQLAGEVGTIFHDPGAGAGYVAGPLRVAGDTSGLAAAARASH